MGNVPKRQQPDHRNKALIVKNTSQQFKDRKFKLFIDFSRVLAYKCK